MKKLFALAALAIGMASCSQEMENAATDSQQEIKLTTKITPATRGVNIDEQSTMIKPGQQVGVTISGASASHQNVIWVAGEDGALENQGSPIFYSDNTATITAYQPYNASWTDVASGGSYNFEIATDQSGAGYSQSDLLYTTTTAQKTTESVNLTFKHVLAKITVILNNTNGDSLDDAEIKIINTATNVSFSNGTAAVASSEVNDILAGTGAQAAAIIAPQSVDGGTKIIQVVWNGKTFSYSLPATKEFLSGYAYTYRLRINNSSPEMNLDGSDVEDWNGEENEGTMNEEDIPYVTFSADALQTLQMRPVATLEYSVDGGEWRLVGFDEIEFGGPKGNLRLRAKSRIGLSNYEDGCGEDYNTIKFDNSVPVYCSGDIRTLIDYENYQTTSTKDAQFAWLFDGCSSLVSAPELPSTDLAPSCYMNMFGGCTSLTVAPQLPAKSLAHRCYDSMFNGCTSLKQAPELSAPDLASSCYTAMFWNCTSLTEGPVLPATTLAEDCYRMMFYGCTGLTKSPELLAKTLVRRCYEEMFSGCSNLKYVTMLATNISGEACLSNWLSNVSSTGTFIKNSALTSMPVGNSGIPSDWYVASTDDAHNGYAFVDLGLPSGTLWAIDNVSGTSEYWGGSAGTWDGNVKQYSKYVTDSKYGTVDNLTTLNLDDDMAYLAWGGKWRLPSRLQIQELLDNSTLTCNSSRTTMTLTSKINGKTINFPMERCQDRIISDFYSHSTFYWSNEMNGSISVTSQNGEHTYYDEAVDCLWFNFDERWSGTGASATIKSSGRSIFYDRHYIRPVSLP